MSRLTTGEHVLRPLHHHQTGDKTMAAKRRKPGDWKAVANSRNMTPKLALRGHGLTNIPSMNETGSAAYRRLLDKKK